MLASFTLYTIWLSLFPLKLKHENYAYAGSMFITANSFGIIIIASLCQAFNQTPHNNERAFTPFLMCLISKGSSDGFGSKLSTKCQDIYNFVCVLVCYVGLQTNGMSNFEELCVALLLCAKNELEWRDCFCCLWTFSLFEEQLCFIFHPLTLCGICKSRMQNPWNIVNDLAYAFQCQNRLYLDHCTTQSYMAHDIYLVALLQSLTFISLTLLMLLLLCSCQGRVRYKTPTL